MGNRKKLIMIMGVQRSGTNALYHSLAADPGCTAFNEKPDSSIYFKYYLRPEPELRASLQACPDTVLLKPISESKRRTVADVLKEYKDYEVRIPWIYRHPPNVFYSTVQHWPKQHHDVASFIRGWNERNNRVLDALEAHGDRIAIVRYEDLAGSRSLFMELCGFLGMKGEYRFRGDGMGSIRNKPGPIIVSAETGQGLILDPEVHLMIEDRTAEVMSHLDAGRRFKP